MYQRLLIWYRRFIARGKSKRMEEFREFAQLRELAVHWTTLQCPRCHTPALSDDACYCMKCGLTLEQTTVLNQRSTDVLQDIRPILAYRRAIHTSAGPSTVAHRAMSYKETAQLEKNARALVVRNAR